MTQKNAAICLLFALCTLGWVSTASAALPSVCTNSAAQVISRPVSSNDPQGSHFDYRFSLNPDWNPEIPLLIFIPGGPGSTSMTSALSYPDNMMVVRTDPRGVGCNESELLSPAHISSEEIAKDILAIVQKLKPKKYYLHGLSYGTIVATMAASIIDSEKWPLPTAVILEGTIGRPFEPNEYAAGILQEWKRVKGLLPQNILKILSSSQVPIEVESQRWAAWLASALSMATIASGDDYALNELLSLADESSRQGLQTRVLLMSRPATTAKVTVYKEIACREFVPDVRDVTYDYDWIEGDLVLKNQRLCQGVEFNRSFDSKNYQIKSPIYYFSGGRDGATPPRHTQYHFQNQTAPRHLISVQRAGHMALSNSLSDCSKAFWESLVKSDSKPLEEVFSSCRLREDIKILEK